MQDQVQVPLQAGGVTDHHGPIPAAEAEEVPGGLLLGGVGQKGIGAGEVHKEDALPVADAPPLGGGHCLSRPIPGVLVQIGQGVKDGAFPHVWVAGQGKDPFVVGKALEEQPSVQGGQAGGASC